PDRGAVLMQDGDLALELIDRAAAEVPNIGMLRHYAQGQLLAAAADHEGRVGLLDRLRLAARLLELVVAPVEVGQMLGPEHLCQLARLTQPSDALARLVEWDAHAAMLVLVPACADPKIQPSVRDDVHRRGHVR